MRVVILNQDLRRYFGVFFCFSTGCQCTHAPFFWKDGTSTGSWKNNYFSPGVPLWQHMTPWMRANTGIIRYFEKWGDFEEKVERQGKDDQNVWNEPIDAPLSPWVRSIACWEEIPFSKLNIFKNYPYFKLFRLGECPPWKWGEIRVIFENFEIWKRYFFSTSHIEDPRA